MEVNTEQEGHVTIRVPESTTRKHTINYLPEKKSTIHVSLCIHIHTVQTFLIWVNGVPSKSQRPSFFLERMSPWLNTHQESQTGRPTSPRDPPFSASPILGFISVCHCTWLFIMPQGFSGGRTLVLTLQKILLYKLSHLTSLKGLS